MRYVITMDLNPAGGATRVRAAQARGGREAPSSWPERHRETLDAIAHARMEADTVRAFDAPGCRTYVPAAAPADELPE